MTIRIFVGCAPNHDDAESQAVLEYTIRKYTSRPVDITWMKLSRDPTSPFHSWNTSTWATPFSGFRYAVPALCDYQGRAIYMDSDVIVRADLAALWDRPMANKVVAKTYSRLCVSLWNCAAFDPVSLDDLKRGVRPVLNGVEAFRPSENWNCLDGEDYGSLDDSEIKAIHYTSMPHQPHLPHALARLGARGHWFDGKVTPHWRTDLVALWERLYSDAQSAGYTVERYCQDEPYGKYDKGSVASLRGAVPHWGRKS